MTSSLLGSALLWGCATAFAWLLSIAVYRLIAAEDIAFTTKDAIHVPSMLLVGFIIRLNREWWRG